MLVLVVAAALLLAVIVAVVLRWLAEPILVAQSRPTHPPKCEWVGESAGDSELPSSADLTLSLVVPAYNEKERLPIMLDETIEYLKSRPSFQKEAIEIIVVDDGSKDETAQIASEYATSLRKVSKMGKGSFGYIVLRTLRVTPNCGKGNAVKQGMLRARGSKCLMVDADGASRISDLALLEAALQKVETSDGHGIAIGSRAHLQDDAVAQRTCIRNILMHGFHALVWLLTVRGIKDTQCGFKLFTFATKQVLFENQRIERWCFDPEILMIASWLGIPVAEQAINWQEIAGSKIKASAVANMGRDLFLIRLCYTVGIWTIKSTKKNE